MFHHFKPFSVALVFAVLSFAGATGAGATTLLTNLTSQVDGSYGGYPDSADDFLTGAVGLTIESIDVYWELGRGGINRVGIFADDGGHPGLTQVGGWFTSAETTTSGATINYEGYAKLLANTVYWMAVEISDRSRIGYSFNQVVTSHASTLGADINGKFPASAWGDIALGGWYDDPANLLYALNGIADPAPVQPGNMVDGAAALEPVPLPAGLPLLLAAFGVVGIARARRR
ncbi:choice-of-anchor R domain-containing protein [Tropicimonas sp. IMCC6043]|uniref:choice-of-anchor R domain-containing protein n=1 Tax=Tropicimonas sp. IMCC6043 TaxID=2510645 RepID=UPI00101D4DC7|nr:choice-of-anchor R domain-containing protein [Tropicimonas sp. IMCC6043]